jgi:hypothetical protein
MKSGELLTEDYLPGAVSVAAFGCGLVSQYIEM